MDEPSVRFRYIEIPSALLIMSQRTTEIQVLKMLREYDGLGELFERGAYHKSRAFDLRRIIASYLF